MSEKEREESIRLMKEYIVKLSKSKKLSREFLVRVGIYTPKGNLTKNYKNLCIPEEQD